MQTKLFFWLAALAGLVLATPAQAAPSDVDPTFGENGVVYTKFSDEDPSAARAEGVAVQPDGKVVVVGSGGGGMAVARLARDGSLDPSFTGDGQRVIGPVGQGASAYDVAIAPDGAIFVVGSTHGPGGDQADLLLVKLNPNGSFATNFHFDGVVKSDFQNFVGDIGYSVALAPDGGVVVAGRSGAEHLLVRYEPDGSLDSTFGEGGAVVDSREDPRSGYRDVAIQPDGKIVVVGFPQALTRYTASGSLDETFANGGSFSGLSHSADTLEVDSASRIVLGGITTQNDFRLSRFSPDGVPDGDFNRNANHMVWDPRSNFGAGLHDLAIDSAGRIVATGFLNLTTHNARGVVVRWLPDGAADETFGVRGGRSYSELVIANAIAIGPESEILVSGVDNRTPDIMFATIRIGQVLPFDAGPETFIDPESGEDVTFPEPVRLRFSGADDSTPPEMLHFECKRDRLAWKPCSSPRVYRVRPGRHRFKVRAIDSYPQPDPTPATVTVRVE
jgi:uncharacterized delta-60 repeat protein